MNTYTFLAPPLLGAFIGYMTNYVAIKMLFRPLKPWRLFGIKLPMTPGVIPSKRHDLADNIGKMVGNHLLTSDDVGKALREDSFKHQLEGVVYDKVDELLKRDLGPIASVIPNRFKTYFEAGVKILRWRALKMLHGHLDSDAFGQGLAKTIADHFDDFLKKDLDSYISSEHRDHFFSYLDETINKLLADPRVEEWIYGYISQKTVDVVNQGKTLQDLLPPPFIEILMQVIEKETPAILDKLAKIANEPEMQEKIIQGICRAIKGFIQTLGPMASLASNFLTPEIIEEKVTEYLQEKGGDISQWLNNQTVQNKTSSLLKEKIHHFLNQPIVYMVADVERQKIKDVISAVSKKLTKVLQHPKTSLMITSMLKEAIESQAERPTAETLSDLFGSDGLQKGKEWTAQEVINIIRSKKVKRILDNLVNQLVEKNILERPIGALGNLLPKAVQSGFSEYLLQQTNELLIKEVPGLVDSLNIKQIVTKKVDSLDLLRLEGLLLSIMEEQFKYINIFGGLLGFIIGLLNLIFIF